MWHTSDNFAYCYKIDPIKTSPNAGLRVVSV